MACPVGGRRGVSRRVLHLDATRSGQDWIKAGSIDFADSAEEFMRQISYAGQDLDDIRGTPMDSAQNRRSIRRSPS